MADRTGEIAMESTMEHEPTPATVIQASPFHRLPPEMVHAILCQVQGLSTLGSAVRSCRWLYDVFLTDKARIMTRAVVNELDAYDVRPEVEAAWRASQFVWDKRNLQEYNPRGTFKAFCKRHLAERSVDLELGSTSLNSDDVSAIWRLHSIVSRLTRRYAEGALRKLDRGRRKGCTSLLPLELSVAETGRIMRAFYFLETYYNLFRDVGWMSSTAHYTYVAEFLCHFSGCEMEQFRTIDGFLFSELQPSKCAPTTHVFRSRADSVTPNRLLLLRKARCLVGPNVCAFHVGGTPVPATQPLLPGPRPDRGGDEHGEGLRRAPRPLPPRQFLPGPGHAARL
ncbi:hypothetical protein F5Y17DRAFT_442900 [Xylariaceae sp. FL0594]|nr:hypothetical protein F5Y17DRAFT_442900 [Xylariaceae sp. FL0594]